MATKKGAKVGNRLEEGGCILCGCALLEGTNKVKDVQGMCEECAVKFKEKVEAMRQNPSLRTKGWKYLTSTRRLPDKLRRKVDSFKT